MPASTPSPRLRAALRILEWPSIVFAKTGAWLVLPLIGSLIYEVVSRYIFDAPTIWAYDTTYMFAGTLFMLGAAYALRNGSHVRADFLLASLRPRWQALIDLVLYLFVYFPAITLFLTASGDFAMQSWQERETYPQSPWSPAIYPLKAVIPLTCALLLLQGAAEVLKAVWTLRTDKPFQRTE